ncbi:hypothetical protein PAPHI01_1102 [Pancytospora philotis]|nr:hypothetical protein PAPHI01_1102 [Pancytospora philotis]
MAEQNFAASQQPEKRKRMWRAAEPAANYSISGVDKANILSEFIRKVECSTNHRTYTPNPDKDAYLTKQADTVCFSFDTPGLRAKFLAPLQCKQLRTQSFCLLEIIRREHLRIEKLIDDFHGAQDEDTRMCIHQLVMRKKSNLLYMERIRESIAELICLGEEGIEFLARCCKIVNAN